MRELNVDLVRAVERAFQILNCFSFDRPHLTIAEIIDKTKLPKATVYRLLWTLEQNGQIQYDQKENTYRLGHKLLEYGGIVLENLDIRREAAPYLQQLHETTGHSTVLAIPQGETLQYLMRIDSDEGFQPRNFVGRKRALHNGAFGIILLSYMEESFVHDLLERYPLEAITPNTVVDKGLFLQRLHEARENGYYVDDGETFVGFTAVAAPVFDMKDNAIAAIGASGPSFKMEGELRDKLIRQITDMSQRISQRMGYIRK